VLIQLRFVNSGEATSVTCPLFSLGVVDFLVLLQGDAEREFLSTNLTNKISFAALVSSFVALESQRRSKGFAANWTDERALASVLTQVVFKVERSVERETAKLAGLDTVRITTFVLHVHVIGQPAGPPEFLAADLANLRFADLPGFQVLEHVTPYVCFRPKTFLAKVARKRVFIWVFKQHVSR